MDEHREDELITGALRMLRTHLGLDVAFVSQLTEGLRVFRHVDAADRELVRVGDAGPAEESYCRHVVDGDVPQFLHDASTHPVTAAMEVTRELPVGTHLSVPLVLSDGSVYGTFCGFTHQVAHDLSERSLETVRLLAAVVAAHVERAEERRQSEARRRARLRQLEPGLDLVGVAQPIVDLATRRSVGFEVLARFPTLGQGPAEVFDDAWALGVGPDLELAAAGLALDALRELPDDCSVAVNAAPDTLTDARFLDAVRASQPNRVVVEVTEHARVTDYPALRAAIDTLQALGARLAVDDVGTGFSGLDHILRLEPDILKIDGALVRDLDVHRGKQAMVGALVTFARTVGASLVAEQVETSAELRALTRIGVDHAQGYLLGRPAPLADLLPAPARGASRSSA